MGSWVLNSFCKFLDFKTNSYMQFARSEINILDNIDLIKGRSSGSATSSSKIHFPLSLANVNVQDMPRYLSSSNN